MVSDLEEGLYLVEDDEEQEDGPGEEGQVDPDLESLRSEFVAAFNARDLEAILAIVHPEVECPDRRTSGAAELAEDLASIWHRSPGAMLTAALLDGTPCAVAWLPDDDGCCWSRAALVCLDAEDGLLRALEIPDDADALDRAEAEDPDGEEIDQGLGWQEWDTGDLTPLRRR